MNDQNGLNFVVAWAGKNTTSGLSNITLESNNATSGAQGVVDSIFSANNCTSGVIAIPSSVDQYIISSMEDRFEQLNSTDLNVYVWGVKEDCEASS